MPRRKRNDGGINPKSRDPWGPRQSSSPRTKASLAVRAFDEIEAAIGGRDAVVNALSAVDLSEEQRTLFGMIADPRFKERSLAQICHKTHVSLGQLLQLFKDAKLAKAQIEAIAKLAGQIPAVAEDAMELARIKRETCSPCDGTGLVTKGEGKKEHQAECGSCGGTGTHVYIPSLDRQKFALELGGLYQPSSGGGVRVAVLNTPPAAPTNGGKLDRDYLREMRVGTDKLLYPGRQHSEDTSDVVDAQEIPQALPASVDEVSLVPAVPAPAAESETKANTPTQADPYTRSTRSTRSTSDTSVVPLGETPFFAPAGARPR